MQPETDAQYGKWLKPSNLAQLRATGKFTQPSLCVKHPILAEKYVFHSTVVFHLPVQKHSLSYFRIYDKPRRTLKSTTATVLALIKTTQIQRYLENAIFLDTSVKQFLLISILLIFKPRVPSLVTKYFKIHSFSLI